MLQLHLKPNGEPLRWYINLQAPAVRTAWGIDTSDHFLDVVRSPDRSSHEWKDEAELSEAVARGLLTSDEAVAVREAGEREPASVLAGEYPFDAQWLSWTPDAGWSQPELPEGAATAPA